MRVLISAFAISPYRGSEAGVGWEFALRLARDHDVTVIYGDLDGARDREAELNSWIEANADGPKMTFIYVAPSPTAILFARLHAKPGLRPLYYAAYRLWQVRALRTALKLHQQDPFDVVHQLTYATYWEPGYLWKLQVPFFWGPISGRNIMPLRYMPILGAIGSIEAVARFVLNRTTLLTHPRIGRASHKASRIWCVTSEEEDVLARYTDRISRMLEVGIAAKETRYRSLPKGETLRIVWSGLHIPRKALPLLIRAIARIDKRTSIAVDVLGAARKGDRETEKNQRLVERLDQSGRITFHGNLPRSAAMEVMNRCHVLMHTSLLEGTSTAVIEALSMGMPVICHDACGMALAVTPECGIKVPMTGIDDSVKGFAAAIQTLLDHPEMVEQLSKGAIKRAGELGWDAKIAEINRAYEEALAPRVANV